MDILNGVLGVVLERYFALFRWAHPILGLSVLAAVAGAAMLWVFRRVSDQPAIATAKRTVYAHLMELRLYTDEPAVVWRAQRDLLAANARYLGHMLRPAVIVAVPMIILLVRLDAYYGRAPLIVGQEAIVTLKARDHLTPGAPAPALRAPDGIRVETPGVRILPDDEVVWRIRPVRPVSGELTFNLPGESVGKRIEAGNGFRFVPGRRTASIAGEVWYGDEPRLAARDVDWIDIAYPEASIEFLGIRWHWMVWFTAVSILAALLLKKRLRVTL